MGRTSPFRVLFLNISRTFTSHGFPPFLCAHQNRADGPRSREPWPRLHRSAKVGTAAAKPAPLPSRRFRARAARGASGRYGQISPWCQGLCKTSSLCSLAFLSCCLSLPVILLLEAGLILFFMQLKFLFRDKLKMGFCLCFCFVMV